MSPAPERAADLLIVCGIGLAAIGALLLFQGALGWGLTGTWPGWSIEEGLAVILGCDPTASHLDEPMLRPMLDLPLAAALNLGGILLFRLATEIVDPI